MHLGWIVVEPPVASVSEPSPALLAEVSGGCVGEIRRGADPEEACQPTEVIGHGVAHLDGHHVARQTAA